MTEALEALAPHFFQVAWVVRDIEAGEDWLARTLGVRGFTRLPEIHLGPGCEYRGAPSDCVVHLSLGWMKDTNVELIEHVRGDCIYLEQLEQRGPGLHHVAFLAPDFDAALGLLEADGLPLAARGALGPGMQFAYFDCEGPGFSMVELLGFDDATLGFMRSLREQAG